MSNAVLKEEHDQRAKFTKFQSEDFTSISKFTKVSSDALSHLSDVSGSVRSMQVLKKY